jgi:hypothetical protein
VKAELGIKAKQGKDEVTEVGGAYTLREPMGVCAGAFSSEGDVPVTLVATDTYYARFNTS